MRLNEQQYGRTGLRSIFVLALVILFSGCTKTDPASIDKMVGKWEFDKKLFREISMKAMKNVGGSVSAAQEKTLDDNIAKFRMELEFSGDGTYILESQIDPSNKESISTQTGTWKFVDSDLDQPTFKMKPDDKTKRDADAKIDQQKTS